MRTKQKHTVYWYTPKYRPPSFCTMPDKGVFVEIDKQFPGKPFTARAYSAPLGKDEIEKYQLELVCEEAGQ